jgi:hypothetical protein
MTTKTWCWSVALAAILPFADGARADEPVRLQERFPVGYQYHVSTRVDLSGTLTPPPEKAKAAPRPVAMNGDSAIEYDERVLAVAPDGRVTKTARFCRRMDFRRTVAGRPQQSSLRPEVRRLVLLRHNNTEVPFSPDGPLTWGEIDLVRTDVFTPALASLLPEGPVRAGDRWTASTAAVQELTDMERIDEGKLECRLEGVITRGTRRQAKVTFHGEVRGTNEDGASRQQLQGHYLFDLDGGYLSYLLLKGAHSLLEKDGREVGRIEGRFALDRQVRAAPELSDAAVRPLTVEPNENNTLLLYDNPDLGVRFLYPRRWRVSGVRGTQVTLDTSDGSGLLLTLDTTARTPGGAQFLAESRGWLEKQKARLLRTEPPRRVQESPPLEQFALEAEMGGQRFLMDYYVGRQALGGVTLAARLPSGDVGALRREVERIARSVTVTRRQ